MNEYTSLMNLSNDILNSIIANFLYDKVFFAMNAKCLRQRFINEHLVPDGLGMQGRRRHRITDGINNSGRPDVVVGE